MFALKSLSLVILACFNFLNATVVSQLLVKNTDLHTFAYIYLGLGFATSLTLLVSAMQSFEVKLKDEE